MISHTVTKAEHKSEFVPTKTPNTSPSWASSWVSLVKGWENIDRVRTTCRSRFKTFQGPSMRATHLSWVQPDPHLLWPIRRFSIKEISYQYRDFHLKVETIMRPSHLYNKNSYTCKSLYQNQPLLMPYSIFVNISLCVCAWFVGGNYLHICFVQLFYMMGPSHYLKQCWVIKESILIKCHLQNTVI